jgi:hypothetical protein
MPSLATRLAPHQDATRIAQSQAEGPPADANFPSPNAVRKYRRQANAAAGLTSNALRKYSRPQRDRAAPKRGPAVGATTQQLQSSHA